MLGGLAVLTHVGIIGMSVPYLLSLTQPRKESAAATIPIEFVVADESASETQPVAEGVEATQANSSQSDAAADNSQVNRDLTVSEPVRTSVNSIETAPSTKPHRSDSRANKNLEPSTQTAPIPDEMDRNRPSSEDQAAASDTEPRETSALDSEPSGSEQTMPAPITPPSEGQSSSDEGNLEEGPPEEAQPEVLAGEPLQPPPSTTDESGKSVLMAIGDWREDVVQDAPDRSPQLKTGRELGRRTPEAEGCGLVALPEETLSLVYRLRIGEDGLVELATLQPTGDGALLSGETGCAIACLIETAGMEFSPAIANGEPKLDDSLLVTFELIDAG